MISFLFSLFFFFFFISIFSLPRDGLYMTTVNDIRMLLVTDVMRIQDMNLILSVALFHLSMDACSMSQVITIHCSVVIITI